MLQLQRMTEKFIWKKQQEKSRDNFKKQKREERPASSLEHLQSGVKTCPTSVTRSWPEGRRRRQSCGLEQVTRQEPGALGVHVERKGTGAECVAFYLRDLASYPEIHSWQSQGLSREKDVTLEQKAASMPVCLISGLGDVSKA